MIFCIFFSIVPSEAPQSVKASARSKNAITLNWEVRLLLYSLTRFSFSLSLSPPLLFFYSRPKLPVVMVSLQTTQSLTGRPQEE